MLPKLNIYLLAALLLGGLALAVRASDRPSVVPRDRAIEHSSRQSTGETPAAPDNSDPTMLWFPDFSELSVPVQFAFAAVRTVVAEGSALRIPIPELSTRATRDLTERWLGDRLGSIRAASPTAWRMDDSQGSGIRLFLRTTIRRLGPPRHV